ncbi:spore germination protein GerW family protein [uncultured Leifsonia sp.]|uniref:spore germination protein GerW family protein n=1 Tax=uncultured Leifsonia sp. TaxID=340359 RepID=UPI0025F728CF|nr:spore germination protein GerW family protein [uncultured Leifsonia sp.]
MTNLSLKLAETMSSSGIKSVYGEPIVVDGTTIVPVAAVQFGFGAGEAGGTGDDDAPGGAGGGGAAVPFGAYVSDETGVRFRPNIITLLAVAIPFVWVAGHAWARVIKALKR